MVGSAATTLSLSVTWIRHRQSLLSDDVSHALRAVGHALRADFDHVDAEGTSLSHGRGEGAGSAELAGDWVSEQGAEALGQGQQRRDLDAGVDSAAV